MLSAIDKIIKARIGLQKFHPFFAYLTMSLKPIEAEWQKTMGIDIYGNLYYNPEWVECLEDKELIGVLIHEILHLSCLHFIREGNRNHQISNIAQDIVINYLIKQNEFVLPKDCLWCNDKNEIIVFNKKIKDVDKKVWEEVYDEIYSDLKEKLKKAIISGKAQIGYGGDGEGIEIELDDYEIEGSTNTDSSGKGKAKNMDNHIRGKNGKSLSQEERKEKEREWLNKVQEAYVGSKMAGKVPVGIERLVGALHESKIDWKSLLLRYVESYIPQDFTYARPNKKSIASGYYMADTIKERINVAVMIDVSGSIGGQELQDFISEIVGMARAFRNKIKFTIYTHETDINGKWVVENGSVEKIKQIKIKGGGGTSFIIPYRSLLKQKDKNKVIVWLTDGYGDKIPKSELKNDIIWCLSKNSDDNLIKGLGKIIRLK